LWPYQNRLHHTYFCPYLDHDHLDIIDMPHITEFKSMMSHT
jgi:hypothetical protein